MLSKYRLLLPNMRFSPPDGGISSNRRRQRVVVQFEIKERKTEISRNFLAIGIELQ
jgi:hypothetical protein